MDITNQSLEYVLIVLYRFYIFGERNFYNLLLSFGKNFLPNSPK